MHLTQSIARTVMELNAADWPADIGQRIKTLWKDPIIQEVYTMRDKFFQLNDSTS